MRVRAPGSSANLGPGFDCLGLAIDVPFVLSDQPEPNLLPVEPRHPAAVAHHHAGGEGALFWKSSIPPGRGQGFSGAARVAGAFLAACQSGLDDAAARVRAFHEATELEGHPDNAAPSAFGGFTVASRHRWCTISCAIDFELVMWWPQASTSTQQSRSVLPDTVSLDDAVFNVGRSSLLVAALASGDAELVGYAMQDRLHQRQRLEAAPGSLEVFEMWEEMGAISVWLSGSGPTVAAMVQPGDTERFCALMTEGRVRVTGVDQQGAQRVDPT